MVLRVLRPLLAILIAIALPGAPSVQAASVVQCDTMQMAADHQVSPGDTRAPAPCKGVTPACVDALGCVSTASLPAPPISALGPLTWIPVAYGSAADAREGLSVKPALDPPIPLA